MLVVLLIFILKLLFYDMNLNHYSGAKEHEIVWERKGEE